jgi:transposase
VAERVRVRDITNEEGNRLLRIVRRSSGSVVTWRRAQMVLLSAQAMDVAMIAQVTFTSPDRVRDVLHNFNLDGFDSLYPRYAGGRPPTFTLVQRRQIKQVALSRPVDHDLPFSTWSLAKLADFLVAEGVVDDHLPRGPAGPAPPGGVSFQRLKTWKQSHDPDFEAKKNRILHLYGLMDGTHDVEPGDPDVVLCVDEFGPLNLQPHPGRHWAVQGGGGAQPRRRRRATYTRPHGVRHLLAAYDLSRDRLYGHIKPRKRRGEFLVFLRYLRTLYPPEVRIGLVLDNFSPAAVHHRRPQGGRVGGSQQHRTGLHPHQRVVVEPDRGPVPGAALLHPGRHRSRQPPRPGQHDSPLHRVAEPQRPRPPIPPNRQQGKGCLTRH